MTLQALIVAPDPTWPAWFASERERLAAALAGLTHELHHIGSTAIPGIAAKPVIDMLLLVDDLHELDARSSLLIDAGYEAKGEFGLPGRRYFRRTTPQGLRTHHLHTYLRGSSEAQRHLAFRDYMRAHPAAAAAYDALKWRLVAAHGQDAAAYIAGKAAFVRQHEVLALAWWPTRAT